MSLPTLTKRTFFSIQRIADHCEGDHEAGNGVIEIYLLYNGRISFEKRNSRLSIESGTLYWACHDDYEKKRISVGAEGYVLRFSKSLLRYCRQDTYGAIFSSLCPPPYQNETIQMEDSFVDDSKWLCETMRQEYRGKQSSRVQVLAGLLGVFVALLVRCANAFTPLAAEPAGI